MICDFDHAARCYLCVSRVGLDCPHCIAGEYATDTKGRVVYCDACRATGKVVAVTEFSALSSAVIAKGVDITAALALADYLNERGDERGTRLRNRVKRFEKNIAKINEFGRQIEECRVNLTPERIELKRKAMTGILEWRKRRIESETDTFIRYFFRLLSVASGEPTPRERVGGSYVLIEPKGWEAS